MKNILLIISFLFTSGLFAQGIYNNGGKIVIGSGVTLNISGTGGNYRNETNVTNGSVDLSGNLVIAGNVTNNVSTADFLGTIATNSQVTFNGTTPQTIGGVTASPFLFPNLTINNNSGVVLLNNVQVNGTMTFTNGLVNIGNNNFLFGPSAVVAGTPSTTSMIIATGSGQVQKNWLTTGTFTFPVGDNNLSAKYSPVNLTFTGGTFAAGAFTGLNLVNAKYNDPSITGSYLNRYWNLSQTGITGFTSNANFQYLTSDVVGTEGSINGLMVLPLPVTIYTPANSTLHQLNMNGLTSFGTFTGGPGNKTLNLTSVMLQSLYSSAGVMFQAWDSFGPHWPAGIADVITVELHSSVAGSYGTIVYSTSGVQLSTTGNATLTIPATFSGSYYITIKHRNSLETTTATAVSFAGSTISQSFGTSANVFGGNLFASIDGHFLIYSGDVNQDGMIDLRDYSSVDNDAFIFASGYLNTDVNGDGVVDIRDFSIIDNNNYNFISAMHP